MHTLRNRLTNYNNSNYKYDISYPRKIIIFAASFFLLSFASFFVASPQAEAAACTLPFKPSTVIATTLYPNQQFQVKCNYRNIYAQYGNGGVEVNTSNMSSCGAGRWSEDDNIVFACTAPNVENATYTNVNCIIKMAGCTQTNLAYKYKTAGVVFSKISTTLKYWGTPASISWSQSKAADTVAYIQKGSTRVSNWGIPKRMSAGAHTTAASALNKVDLDFTGRSATVSIVVETSVGTSNSNGPSNVVMTGRAVFPITINDRVPPTPTPCATKPQGDANCDGKIDVENDYPLLLQSLTKEYKSATDFNNDGKVDGLDFEIWRNAFYK